MKGLFERSGLRKGILGAGIGGVIGAVALGGVAALLGGPVAILTAVGAGVFGLIGTLGGVVDASTDGKSYYEAAWFGGLATTAAVTTGAYVMGVQLSNDPPSAPPNPSAALHQTFNTAALDNAQAAIPNVPAYVPIKRAFA